jgi:hypothetical protein
VTRWPPWRVDLAWDLLHRVSAFKHLYDGTISKLTPQSAHDVTLLATGSEQKAEDARERREEAILNQVGSANDDE